MVNKHMKGCSDHVSSGQYKLKQPDTTTCLLEWPKSGTPPTLNAGEDMKQPELSSIAGGNAKWDSHLGWQFGGFL